MNTAATSAPSVTSGGPLRHALRWALGIGLVVVLFVLPLAAYL